MLPQRPSGSHPAARKSGPFGFPQAPYEAVKRRVLDKLEERLDMSASKRMPQSLLRQSLRQHAEQIADQEARGFAKADRDRLIDEVLAELLGYGPLEELFADPAVREVMVTGPGTVIARRDLAQWLPTSVKFRDEEHVRATLDRIATHADPVGPVMASMVVFDMKLPNGFRALAMIPPEALAQPATATFLRQTTIPVPVAAPKKDASGALPGLSATASTSHGTIKTVPASVPASPRAPGSGLVTTPPPRASAADPVSGSTFTSPTVSASAAHDLLARHRTRITERLLAKFASLKVFDLTRFDPNELRKVISAYVSEYAGTEKVYLSDTDQGRLTLEILTSLRR
jgi:hypothetical protein